MFVLGLPNNLLAEHMFVLLGVRLVFVVGGSRYVEVFGRQDMIMVMGFCFVLGFSTFVVVRIRSWRKTCLCCFTLVSSNKQRHQQ